MNTKVLAFADNSEIIKIIVKALDKAYGIDYRQMRENDDLVAHMFAGVWKICRFDTNLVESLSMDGVEVACFGRHGWNIYFVADHRNRRTFNVVSKNTIQRVRRKRGGKVPHYMRSFLYIENADVKAARPQDLQGRTNASVAPLHPRRSPSVSFALYAPTGTRWWIHPPGETGRGNPVHAVS